MLQLPTNQIQLAIESESVTTMVDYAYRRPIFFQVLPLPVPLPQVAVNLIAAKATVGVQDVDGRTEAKGASMRRLDGMVPGISWGHGTST